MAKKGRKAIVTQNLLKVVMFLKDNSEPISPTNIGMNALMMEYGQASSRAAPYLKRLLKMGYIYKIGNGPKVKYALTEEGLKWGNNVSLGDPLRS